MRTLLLRRSNFEPLAPRDDAAAQVDHFEMPCWPRKLQA